MTTPTPAHKAADEDLEIRVHHGRSLTEHGAGFDDYATRLGCVRLSDLPAWWRVLAEGLGHAPYILEATEAGQTRGLLALAYLSSPLFGRYLVSLPYLNYGGVLASDERVAGLLIDGAIALADRLEVRYLELRSERAVAHPQLVRRDVDKVHMRRELPATPDALWGRLSCRVRNQVRKGRKNGLSVVWGGANLLAEFYTVFSHNMRDLGTPVYGRRLFQGVLRHFPGTTELCVVRAGTRPLAAALLLHGQGTTEVPSSSSLRSHNTTCANMLMYWHLLERAIDRGQSCFDFGRSSPRSNTARFKAQWGAIPFPAEWQYYVRSGSISDLRTDSPKYQRLVRVWQRLPVTLTRWIGPPIVRGIP